MPRALGELGRVVVRVAAAPRYRPARRTRRRSLPAVSGPAAGPRSRHRSRARPRFPFWGIMDERYLESERDGWNRPPDVVLSET